MSRKRSLLLLYGLFLLLDAPADATVPGYNGLLAYQEYAQPETRMKTATAAGLDVRDIGAGTSPAWSPDGRLIAYTEVRQTADGPVYRMHVRSADGKFDRVVLAGSSLGSAYPGWSPNGESIVFTGI